MTRIDFYISNSNHHWQMLSPIMVELKKRDIPVRLVSLCEFRRMETPENELTGLGIPFVKLLDLKKQGLNTSSGRSIGGNKGFFRNLLRTLVWWLRLRREVIRVNLLKPTFIVVPNDIAFPFDKICAWFNAQSIPFLLMQEGIRFPLPNEDVGLNYGKNGAQKIICWGQHSADYFNSIGIDHAKLIAGGNPRFDNALRADYSNDIKEIRRKFLLTEHTILYVSNPIDDQGFCTHEQKMNLFETFVTGMKPYLWADKVKILVRLHPREDVGIFNEVIASHGLQTQVLVVQQFPIFACIQAAQLCVVLASTVGLEAAINHVPLAVLQLPKHGFVYDYVSSGCAWGVDFRPGWPEKIWLMLTKEKMSWREAGERYAANQLANQDNSARFIADQLLGVISKA